MKMIYKILFFIYIFNIGLCAIEDPVARHDLSECSTYLCPKYRNIAKDYLSNGCVGEFKDYFNENFDTTKINKEIEFISENENNINDLNDINHILFLMSISTLISFYIGFIFGKKEKEDETKILIKEIEYS